MMQIVINIPEEAYNLITGKIDTANIDLYSTLINATVNGTPLPEGHGNLCDENQIVGSLVWGEFLKDDVKCGDITRVLDMATIIEADKSESKDGSVKRVDENKLYRECTNPND